MTPQELAKSGREGLIAARAALLTRFASADATERTQIATSVDVINSLLNDMDLDVLLAASTAVGQASDQLQSAVDSARLQAFNQAFQVIVDALNKLEKAKMEAHVSAPPSAAPPVGASPTSKPPSAPGLSTGQPANIQPAGGQPSGGAAAGSATNNVNEIAWGAKVSPQFKQKVIQMCSMLGCNPDHLMAAMAFESAETFSPSIKNKVSGATGLIQFMPATAKGLGTTVEALAAMTAVEQLDFVLKYFLPMKGRMKTLSDLYMAILFPIAVGKPEDTVLFKKPSIQYQQNAGLDADDDGIVTKTEAAAMVDAKLQKGLGKGFKG
jgi:hypothetical protein